MSESPENKNDQVVDSANNMQSMQASDVAAKKKRGRPIGYKMPPPPEPDALHAFDAIYKQAGLILSVGKSRQGKSYLVRYLLYNGITNSVNIPADRLFRFGCVFSGSRLMNSDYSSFLPANCIHEYSDEALQKYVEMLTERKNKLKAEGKEDQMPSSFIVFDDILGQLNRSKYTTSFFSLYRHLNITVFLNSQYLASDASSTLVRQQTTVGFFFKCSNSKGVKLIYEWFGQASRLDYKEFNNKFDKITKIPYNAMMYIDHENRPNFNYLSFEAPENFKPVKVSFGGKKKE